MGTMSTAFVGLAVLILGLVAAMAVVFAVAGVCTAYAIIKDLFFSKDPWP